MYGIFSSRTYDSLDPQDQSFIKDYEKFKTRTFELVIIFLLNGSRVSGKLMYWFQSISIMILIDISMIDDRPTDRLSVCNSLDKDKLCFRNNSIGSSASR